MGPEWELCFAHICGLFKGVDNCAVIVLRGFHPIRLRGSGTVQLDGRGLTYSPLLIDNFLFGT